jgi:hypothetical protein
MSIATPATSFVVTGGASFTITVGSWNSSTPLASTLTINGHSHTVGEFFDSVSIGNTNSSGFSLRGDLATASALSATSMAFEYLVNMLQLILEQYILQASQSVGVPYVITIS